MKSFSWRAWLKSLLSSHGKRERRADRSLLLEKLESRIAPTAYVWQGGNGPAWSTPANWVGNVAPLATTPADSLVFNNTVATANRATINDISTNPVNVGAITISGDGWSLSGAGLTLGSTGSPANPTGGGGILSVVAGFSGGTDTISLTLTLGAGNAGIAQDVIAVGSGATLQMDGNLVGQANAELINNGPGILKITSDNSGGGLASAAMNGPIDIQQGTVIITNASALGDAASTNTVTVESTSGISGTLEIDNSGNTITAPIQNQLLLNGPGSLGLGALVYLDAPLPGGSSNTASWSGSITLDSDSSIGALNGVGSGEMIITGSIGDTSTGHGITKEGAGKVVFAGPNTYRGVTRINNGILDVQNAKGLGAGDGTAVTGTVINTTANEAGTLEIEDPIIQTIGKLQAGSTLITIPVNALTNTLAVGKAITGPGIQAGSVITAILFGPASGSSTISISNSATLTATGSPLTFGGGFTINNEQLTVRGGGSGTVPSNLVSPDNATVDNLAGTNVWAGPVILDSPSTSPVPVVLGAAAGSSLTIGGVNTQTGLPVASPDITNGPLFQAPAVGPLLQKVGPGTVIFTTGNSYTGPTEVLNGILEIEDSNALGLTQGTIQSAGTIIQGSTLITNPPTIANLKPGELVTGIGIPPGTYITSISGNSVVPIGATGNVVAGSNVIRNMSSTANLALGMLVTGFGIPANTTISGINAANGTISISNAAFGTLVGAALTFQVAIAISNPATETSQNFFLGGTTPLAFSTGVTVSQPQPVTLVGNTTLGSNVIDHLTSQPGSPLSFAGLSVGMLVTGLGIPAGTYITALNTGSSVTLSNPALFSFVGSALTFTSGSTPNVVATQGGTTSGSSTIGGLASTANLYVGMQVSGPGIPMNTRISSIVDPATITISNAATATAATASLTFTGPTIWGSLELADDFHWQTNTLDSLTTNTNHLTVTKDLFLNGPGFLGLGALYNHTGINAVVGAADVTNAAIGSDPVSVDPFTQPTGAPYNYDIPGNTYLVNLPNNVLENAALDNSLSVNNLTNMIPNVYVDPLNGPQVLNPLPLTKVGQGQLMIPDASPNYSGPTTINQGALIVGNSSSLGVNDPTKGLGAQSPITVNAGGALQLLPQLNEVQTVTITGAQGGTFTLSAINPVTGLVQTTAPIASNATAAEVQTALQNLSNLGSGNVLVAAPAAGGPYTVTFTGVLTGAPQPLLSANSAGLIPFPGLAALTATVTPVLVNQGAPTAIHLVNNLVLNGVGTGVSQVVTVNNATGGSFQLVFNGQTTVPIAFSAPASAVQAALAALSTVGAGNVAVSAPGPTGGPYSISFLGALGNSALPLLSAVNTGLAPVGASATVGITNASYQLTVTGSGSGTLSFNGQTTGPIPFNVALTGNTSSGTSFITNPSATSNLAVGTLITGPGIPSNTTITAVNASPVPLLTESVSTSAGSTTLNNLSLGTSSLILGMQVTGAGIPANTFIQGITPTTLTFANTVLGSTTVTGVVAASSLVVGALITGPGIPANTTITAINTATNTVTLSKPATATANAVTLASGGTVTLSNPASATATNVLLTFNGISYTSSSGSNIISVGSTSTLAVGMLVSGQGIPANTFITAVNQAQQTISVSNAANATVNSTAAHTALIATTTLTISSVASATATGVPLTVSASTAFIQSALASLSTVGAGNVTVTAHDIGGPYIINFLGTMTNQQLPLLGISPGAPLTLTLASAAYPLVNQSGALVNLSGLNSASGNIELTTPLASPAVPGIGNITQNGQVGLGVEQIYQSSEPNQPNYTPSQAMSQLILGGQLADPLASGAGTPSTGGIIKLGTQRLVIQGPGTYSGNVDIHQGVLLNQNSTGLGLGGDPASGNPLPSTTVEVGAALELAGGTAPENGGIAAGIQVRNEQLILNGTGDPTFGDGAFAVLSNNRGFEQVINLVNPTLTPQTSFTLGFPDQATGQPFTNPQPIIWSDNPTQDAAAIRQTLLQLFQTTNPATGAPVAPPGSTVTVIPNSTDTVFNVILGGPLAGKSAPVTITVTQAAATPPLNPQQVATGFVTAIDSPVGDPITASQNMWNGPITINTSFRVTYQGAALGGAASQLPMSAIVGPIGTSAGLSGASPSISVSTSTAGGTSQYAVQTAGQQFTAVQTLTFGGGISGGQFTLSVPFATTAATAQNQTIVTPTSLNGLVPGMTVTGSGIPAGTTLVSVNSGPLPSVAVTGSTTSGSTSLTNLSSVSGLGLGMTVTGSGIPLGTTIVAIPNATTVTLSNAALTTGASVALTMTSSQSPYTSTLTASTTSGSTTLSGLASTTNLGVGFKVSGPGIPANTWITAITGPSTVTLSSAATATAANVSLSVTTTVLSLTTGVTGNTTNGSTTISGLASTSSLGIGMRLSGSGIPANTFIVAIPNATTVTLSNPASATAVGVALTVYGTPLTGQTTRGNTTVTVNSTSNLAVGMLVSGTGIAANTFITAINSPTSITLSNPAIATAASAGLSASTTVTLSNPSVLTLEDATLTFTGTTAPIQWPAAPGGSTTGINAPTLQANIQAALDNLFASLGLPGSSIQVAPVGVVGSIQPTQTGAPQSALILNGPIDDGATAQQPLFVGGTDLTWTGAGEVIQAGFNTYRGTTTVQPGVVLTVANDRALGATGLPTIQTISIAGAVSNSTVLTLNFNNSPQPKTVTLTGNPNTDAANIQAALMNLTTVNGPVTVNGVTKPSDLGGLITVTPSPNSAGNSVSYVLNFQGSFLGFSQPLISVATGTQAQTVNTTANQSTITTSTANVVSAGMTVSGPGIVPNTTVTAVNGTLVTLSNPVTLTQSGVSLTFSPVVGASIVQNGTGAAVVQNGATLQMQGDVALGGKPLLVQGSGINTAPNVPQQWFAVGPAPVTGGHTIDNNKVTGRITSVVVDPTDPKTIYIGTAGGGAWKTVDGGNNWRPLFDGIPEVQQIILNGALANSTTFQLQASSDPRDLTAPLQYTGTDVDAINIQNALNGLLSIGGAGGFVTVNQIGGIQFTFPAFPEFENYAYAGTAAPAAFLYDPATTTANQFQIFLSTIPTLAAAGRISVSGPVGGPFTVTFTNSQASNLFTVAQGSAKISGIASVYSVTFSGGTLNGVNFPALTVSQSGVAAPFPASITTNAVGSQVALFTGAITLATTPGFTASSPGTAVYQPQTIFLGTGDTTNQTDSFYGTGIYESTDSGATWQQVQGNGLIVPTNTFSNGVTEFQGTLTNPFMGKGISALVYDQFTGRLYASSGDGGNNQNELQTLTFTNFSSNPKNPTMYSVTFDNGTTSPGNPLPGPLAPANPTTTGLLTWLGSLPGQPDNADALAIQAALNGLVNIGGVGGFVTVAPLGNVTQTTQGGVTTTTVQFTVQFRGALNDEQFPLLNISIVPQKGLLQTPMASVVETVQGGVASPPLVVLPQPGPNGTQMVVNGSGGPVGVYRILPQVPGGPSTAGTAGAWFNLTAVTSSNREEQYSENYADPIYGPIPPGTLLIPGTTVQVYVPATNPSALKPVTITVPAINRVTGNFLTDVNGLLLPPEPTQPGTPIPPPAGVGLPLAQTYMIVRPPPQTPGPDDDYRLQFPSKNATWTDLQLIHNPNPVVVGGVLTFQDTVYATLGTEGGTFIPGQYTKEQAFTTTFEANLALGPGTVDNNGVYRLVNPTADTPIWYVGDPLYPLIPGTATLSGAALVNNYGREFGISVFGPSTAFLVGGTFVGASVAAFGVDNESPNEFAAGTLPNWATTPGQPIGGPISTAILGGGVGGALYGNIKISATDSTTQTLPSAPVFPNNVGGNLQYVPPPLATLPGIAIVPADQASFSALFSIAIYPGGTIYASAVSPTGTMGPAPFSTGNILLSPDGGVNWYPAGSLPTTLTNPLGFTTGNGAEPQQGNSANAILVNPFNPDVVYVAGQTSDLSTEIDQIWTSNNHGGVWTDISIGAGTTGPQSAQHVIVPVLDLAAGVMTGLYFGGDGGIWKLDPTTNTYIDANGNLDDDQVYSVATNPTNPNIILAGSQLHGINTDLTGALAWPSLNVVPAPGNLIPSSALGDTLTGGQVAFNPLDGTIAYAAAGNPSNPGAAGLYRINFTVSPTGVVSAAATEILGAGGTTIVPFNTTLFPFAIDSTNPSILLVGGGNPGTFLLQETRDGGSTWTDLTKRFQAIFGLSGNSFPSITSVAMASYQGPFQPDPAFTDVTEQGANSPDPQTYYISDGANIFVTKDDGISWAERTTGTALAGLGSIQQLLVDPRNRDVVYAVRSVFNQGQVWESTNAGRTWTNISSNLPNLPTWTIAIDPRTGNLYVGTDLGVYASFNGGQSWSIFGSGLADVQVRSLEVNQTTNVITAGTYGRGVYQLYLDSAQGKQQMITLSGLDSTTQVQLGINGINSQPITYTGNPDADAFTVQNALNAVLQNNGFNGTVKVTANTSDSTWTVTFQGLLSANPPQLSATVVSPLPPAPLPPPVVNVVPSTGGAFTAVSGSSTWDGPVILGQDTSFGAEGSQVLQNGISTAQVTITGTVSDGSPASSYKVTKVGSGNVVLGGANIYLGQTEVLQGILEVDNPQAIAGINTLVDIGAVLEFESSLLTMEPITLFGDGLTINGHNTGALRNVSHTNTYNGPITLGSNTTIGVDSGSSLTIGDGLGNGGIQGIYDLIKELTGKLIFDDANPLFAPTTQFRVPDLLNDPANILYPQGILISQGILQIQNGAALGAAGNTTTVLDGAQLQLDNQLVLNLSLAPSGQLPSLTLTVNGASTQPIPYTGNSALDALNIQSALQSLPTVGGQGGSVSVLANTADTSFAITFGGNLAGTGQPRVTASITQAGNSASVVSGFTVPATQNLRLTGTGEINTGALESVGGNNTWAGPIVLAQDAGFHPSTFPLLTDHGQPAIGVLAPSPNNPNDSLTITGTISQALQQVLTLSGTTVTLSNAATATATATTGGVALTFSGQTSGAIFVDAVTGSAVVTDDLPANGSFGVGMLVTGPGIPANTTIKAINGQTLTLSNPVGVTMPGLPLRYSGVLTLTVPGVTTANGSTVVANLPTNGNLAVGMLVTGPGIPANTFVTGLPSAATTGNGATQFTLSYNGQSTLVTLPTTGDTAIGSNLLNIVPPNGTLTIGMLVAGPGIPAGTTVTGIAGNSSLITISNPATATGIAVPLTFTGGIITYTGVGAVDALNIQNALNALPSIIAAGTGGVGGAVTVTPDASDTNFTITYHNGVPDNLPITATIVSTGVVPVSFSSGQVGLDKVLGGVLILNPTGGSNSYTNGTTVDGGALRIQQSGALGPNGTGTVVNSGGALQLDGGSSGLVIPGESLVLKGQGSSVPLDLGMTVTGPGIPANTVVTGINGQTVTLSNPATATASGVTLIFSGITTVTATANTVKGSSVVGGLPGNGGALENVSGANTWGGNITLAPTFVGSTEVGTAIGVDSPNSSQTTLTITGTIQDPVPALAPPATTVASLAKVGTGTLILPRANSYSGETDITQGAIKIQNNQALGTPNDEIQTITVTGPLTAVFRLTFNGVMTNFLKVGSTASQVQAALDGLSSISAGGGSVSVSFNAASGIYTIDFNGGPLAGINQLLLQGAISSGSIVIAAIQDGSHGIVVDQGGTLQLDGSGPQPLLVAGKPLTLYGNGFNGQGALENVAGSNTWAGPITLSSTQTVTVASLPSASFQLSFQGQQTSFLPVGAPALTVQNALNNLSSISSTGSTVRVAFNATSGVYTIAFVSGPLAGSPQPLVGTQITAGNISAAYSSSAAGVGVDSASDTLYLSGAIGGQGQGRALGVTKFGPGTMQYGTVQTVTVIGASSGTFTLSFEGQTTGPLPYNVGLSGNTTSGSTFITDPSTLTNLVVGALVTGVGLPANTTITAINAGPLAPTVVTGDTNFGTSAILNLSSTANLVPGQLVSGPGIPANTFIGTIVGNSLTLVDASGNPVNATASGVGVTLTVFGNPFLGSTTFGSTAVTVSSTAGLAVGMQVTGTGIAPNSFISAINAAQLTITLSVAATATSNGSVPLIALPTLSISNATPATVTADALTVNASAAFVQAALAGLSTIGAGNVAVVGTPNGGPYTVNFTGSLANSLQPLLTADPSNLTPLAGAAATVAVTPTASNTYTGQTWVQSGTLQLNRGTVPPNNGATFALAGQQIGLLTVGTGSGSGATVIDLASGQFDPSGVNITVNSDGLFNLNSKAESILQLQINGGTFQTGPTGTLNVTGTLGMVGGTLATGGSASQVTLNQTVTASADAAGNAASISGGGTLVLNGTQTFQVKGPGKKTPAPDLIVTTVISPSAASPNAGLDKEGNGIMELTAVNTYTGMTTIGQGILLADAPTGNTVGAVTLTGGAIGGTGTVGSIITSTRGTVQPGSYSNPTGTLTSGSSVSLTGSDTVSVSLGNLGAGNVGQASILNINGNLSINGAQLTGTAALAYPTGAQFTIVQTSGQISGQFASAGTGQVAVVGQQVFNVTYTANTVVLTRAQNPVSMNLTANPSSSLLAGQPLSLTATVTSTVTGIPAPSGFTVTFMDGSTSLGTAQTDASGVAVLNLRNGLSSGSHSITASFNGRGQYQDASAGPVSLSVSSTNTLIAPSSSVNPSVFGQSVTLSARVSAEFPSTAIPVGTVTFQEGASVLGSATLDATGSASITVPNFSVTGPTSGHLIQVSYSPTSPGFLTSSQPFQQFVNPDQTTTVMTSSTFNTTFGQSVSFTATVSANAPGSGTPAGTVTFRDGVINLTPNPIPLVNGVANFTTTAIGGGNHAITATYNNTDGNYVTSATSVPLSVATIPTTTVLTATPSGGTAAVGQSITFTATVSPGTNLPVKPTGTVTFKNGPFTLGTATLNGSGVASLITSILPQGNNSITAIYTSDGNYSSSISNSLSELVLATSQTTITSLTPNPATFGQSITVNVQVQGVSQTTPTPTGSVTFMSGNTTLGTALLNAGSASGTFNLQTVSAGPETITAVYSGDNVYATSPGNAALTINAAKTATSLSPASSIGMFGSASTIMATVTSSGAPISAIATDAVLFTAMNSSTGATAGSVSAPIDANGQALFNMPLLPVGSYTITASFVPGANGNGTATNYLASKAATSVKYQVKGLPNVSLSGSPSPSFTGQTVVFTAAVNTSPASSRPPTGSVTFTDTFNGKTITLGTRSLNASGIATFSTSSLSLGTHSITATYMGSASFNSNTSTPFTHVVNNSTRTTLQTSVNPFLSETGTETLTARVTSPSGPPTGTVTFTFNGGNPQTVNLNNGQATLVLTGSDLAPGVYSVVATYDGAGTFGSSSSSATKLTVIGPVVAIVGTAPKTALFGGIAFTLTTVRAVDSAGQTVPTFNGPATVTLDSSSPTSINGVTLNKGTSVTGTFVNGVLRLPSLTISSRGTYILDISAGGFTGTLTLTLLTAPGRRS